MCPRSASLTAVSGSARITGCTTAGNRCAEKNTPDRIHIGTCTRLTRPETASIVRGRAASSRPIALNASDAITQMTIRSTMPPRPGTRHRSGHQPLGELPPARVDDRETESPQCIAHDAEADEPGHYEIHIAAARFADELVAGRSGIDAP